MKPVKMFRYTTWYWDEIEEKEGCDTGLLAGKNYADAAARLESIYAIPSTGESELIKMQLEEVDSYDSGALSLNMIRDIFDDVDIEED